MFETGVIDLRIRKAGPPDQPRDDHGRWTSGSSVPLSESDWYVWAEDSPGVQEALAGTITADALDSIGAHLGESGVADYNRIASAIQDHAENGRIRGTLWRGESYASEKEITDRYTRNKVFENESLLSTSPDRSIAEQYAGQTPGGETPKVQVILEYETSTGLHRGVYQGIFAEELGGKTGEVVLPRGSKYRVSDVIKQPDGSFVVRMYQGPKLGAVKKSSNPLTPVIAAFAFEDLLQKMSEPNPGAAQMAAEIDLQAAIQTQLNELLERVLLWAELRLMRKAGPPDEARDDHGRWIEVGFDNETIDETERLRDLFDAKRRTASVFRFPEDRPQILYRGVAEQELNALQQNPEAFIVGGQYSAPVEREHGAQYAATREEAVRAASHDEKIKGVRGQKKFVLTVDARGKMFSHLDPRAETTPELSSQGRYRIPTSRISGNLGVSVSIPFKDVLDVAEISTIKKADSGPPTWSPDDFIGVVTTSLQRGFLAGASDATLTTGISFKNPPERALSFARHRAAEMVGMRRVNGKLVPNPSAKWVISDTLRDDTNRLVNQALQEGWSPQQLTEALEGEYGEARAANIARTETGLAYAAGTVENYRAGGVEFVEVLDGDGCLPLGHDDNAEAADNEPGEVYEFGLAHGQIWTVDQYAEMPLGHPRCVRAVIPYVAVEKVFDPEQPRDDSGRWTTTEIEPTRYTTNIEPRHQVRDSEKLAGLVASMGRDGWVGRPVLAYDDGNGLHALTGSHRVAAARETDIEIPVYVLDLTALQDDYEGSWQEALDVAHDDDDILAAIRQSGDKTAIALMEEEFSLKKTFNPDQPRDDHGRWSDANLLSGQTLFYRHWRPDQTEPGPTAELPIASRGAIEAAKAYQMDAGAWNPALEETVPLSNLLATQASVDAMGIERYLRDPDPDNLPEIGAIGSKFVIFDGHHRTTAAKLRGEKSIRAIVWRPSS